MKDKRILVLRPAGRSEMMVKALEKLGAIPVVIPAVAIVPLEDYSEFDQALNKITDFDWVVVTSVAGAEALSARLGILGVNNYGSAKFAAIGPHTANALQSIGANDVWIPPKYTTNSLGDNLPGTGHALLVRADIADARLDKKLVNRGFQISRIDAYRSISIHDENIRQAVKDGVDAVVLTSASIARAFANATKTMELPGNPMICCIGPPTAEACRQNGVEVTLVAETQTTASMIQAMDDYFKNVGTSV